MLANSEFPPLRLLVDATAYCTGARSAREQVRQLNATVDGLIARLPCNAPTGSEERIAVYAARLALGIPLNQPGDTTATIPARFDCSVPPERQPRAYHVSGVRVTE